MLLYVSALDGVLSTIAFLLIKSYNMLLRIINSHCKDNMSIKISLTFIFIIILIT